MTNRPLFDTLRFWSDDAPHSPAWNMAEDQAWLEATPQPILRVYRWEQPAVSIGYAQRLDKLADALPALPLVRRWTGGGVVFHGQDATYSLIVPARVEWASLNPATTYQQIHASLAEALVTAGNIGCRLAGPDDLIDLPFCFQAPALHDVVRGKTKLAGAGQRRGKLGLLHQGSVQQAVISPDFWLKWARGLSGQVEVIDSLPANVSARAEELVRLRYSVPQWLTDREDLLP